MIYRTGVLAKHGVEIPMDRVNNINFHQGIWERIIGAGDLEIESAGKDGQSNFNDVWHPDGVQQEIYRQMEHAQPKACRLEPAPVRGAAPRRRRRRRSCPSSSSSSPSLRDRGASPPRSSRRRRRSCSSACRR